MGLVLALVSCVLFAFLCFCLLVCIICSKLCPCLSCCRSTSQKSQISNLMCRLPCSSLLPCGSRGYSRPRGQPPPQNLTSPPLIWRVRFLGICNRQYLRNMLYSEQENRLFPCNFPSGGFDSINLTPCVMSAPKSSYSDV